MKRYLLFSFDTYYPDGGWNDFIGDFDNVEQALLALKQDSPYPEYHIIDTLTKEKIISS